MITPKNDMSNCDKNDFDKDNIIQGIPLQQVQKQWYMSYDKCLHTENFYESFLCHYCIINEQIASLYRNNEKDFCSYFATYCIIMMDCSTPLCFGSCLITLLLRDSIMRKYNIEYTCENIMAFICISHALWQQQYELYVNNSLPKYPLVPKMK